MLKAWDFTRYKLKAVLHPPVETYSGPSQASGIELFARIVKACKLASLTNFSKSSIVDICRT